MVVRMDDIYIDDDVYVENSLKREGVARIVCASASAVRSVDRCVEGCLCTCHQKKEKTKL